MQGGLPPMGQSPTSHSLGRLAELAGLRVQLDAAAAASKGWLSAGSHITKLAALGYDTEGLMQQLRSAEAANSAGSSGMHARSVPSQATLLQQLQKHMQSVGMALTSFAHPGACNNPLCSNPAGPSENILVQGKGTKCSGCRAARYSGKACQAAHWKQHKHVCKRVAAAAARAPAGSSDD